jgi:WD40 repeat protein
MRHRTNRRNGSSGEGQPTPLDPVVTLQLGGGETSAGQKSASASSVTSVCFVRGDKDTPTSFSNTPPQEDDGNDEGDTTSSDDDSEDDSSVQLRTQQLVQDDAFALSGRFLASCQTSGDSFLWDLGQRARVQPFAPNRGPALLLRRIDNNKILYQTREEQGTVSLHDVTVADGLQVKAITCLETQSQTFCAAAPCQGNPNLVALPSAVESVATVHDWRSRRPALTIHGAGLSKDEALRRKHGMITSLAFAESSSDTSSTTPVLACGMDSGSLFFHDIRMQRDDDKQALVVTGSIALTKDPILSLDMTASSSNGFVTVAGMAGDVAEPSKGTVAVVKSSTTLDSTTVQTRLREQWIPCQPKPGVSICRFRPDGRVFGVGGWDSRLRIYDRSSCALLAILKGHTASVQAVDWSSEGCWLATGGADGGILLWRCFAKDRCSVV